VQSLEESSAGFPVFRVIVVKITNMESFKPPVSISRTLAAWDVSAPRHPHFRQEVWERIGGGAGPVPWSVFARRHFGAVGGALALALALGAMTGRERARSHAAAVSDRLATAYVQSLDARSMRMP